MKVCCPVVILPAAGIIYAVMKDKKKRERVTD